MAVTVSQRDTYWSHDVRNVDGSGFVTANVKTQSGSHYLVICRPAFGALVIRETDGKVFAGCKTRVIRNRLVLMDRSRRHLLSTSDIVGLHVHES